MDTRLVNSLAGKLQKLKPRPLYQKGQIFKTLPSQDHFALLARQIIYGAKRRIKLPGLPGGTVVGFSGFIERYGRKPKISEIDLDTLRSTRWLEDRAPYTVSECMWYG